MEITQSQVTKTGALRRLRLVAAFVLLGAAFLPLSECSRRENPSLPPVSAPVLQRLFPQSNPDFSYQYAFREVDFSLAGVLTVVAFTWPLLFFFVTDRRWTPRLPRTFLVIELLLCAGTLYWAHAIMWGGRWLYGAYVVLGAVLLFGGTGLVLFLKREPPGIR